MPIHYSPGISAIHNALTGNRKNRILDLGSISSGTFNFFSQNSCKIHFENLDAFVAECGRLSTDNLIYTLRHFLLAHGEAEKFDVILSWDLFNYLKIDAVAALLEQLARHCKPGTLLHSIKYVSDQIPRLPRRFAVRDARSLEFEDTPLYGRGTPRYQTAQLLEKLQHYTVQANFSDREGMHNGVAEQILCYRPDAQARLEQLAGPAVAAQVATDVAASAEFQSPAMAQLLEMLRDSIGVRLLDLGGAAHRAFWLNQNVELVTLDLLSVLRERHRPGGKPVGETIDTLLASCATWRKFDVIVTWDLLNYFTDRELQILAKRLSICSRGNTRLLAYIYSSSEIAVQPQIFALHTDGSLRVQLAPRQRSAKPYTSSARLRQLPGFSVRHSFVFSPGMMPGQVEYLLAPDQ
jgi:hypothetical protein